MPFPVDLHTHTNASDGSDSPAELVAAARDAGLSVLGLTDHDTVDAIAETAEECRRLGIAFIPGVEISTSIRVGESENTPSRLPIHLLGYGIDTTNGPLVDTLASHARARSVRMGQMIERCNQVIERETGRREAISASRVLDIAGKGSIGRPHLAKALIESGYATSIDDVFERYIGRGKPAYVKRAPVDTVEMITLVREAGGAPVLAHPDEYGTLDHLLPVLRRAGLVGMEVWYGEYDDATVNHLLRLAEQHDLVPTGGSDYHGRSVKPSRTLGMTPVPLTSVVALEAAIEAIRAEAR